MSTRVRNVMMRHLGELRHEPIAKRIRATLGGEPVVDSTRALIVYEPRRVVPSFAVPVDDLHAELTPAAPSEAPSDDVGLRLPDVTSLPVLDPSIPFSVHTAEGEPVEVVAANGRAAGFRLADPDLTDYVLLDFGGFDEWYEEDERNIAHPRDPYHRIDVLPSSRHIRLELDGVVLAESNRARLLFESMLPTRYYLPREDVRVPLHVSDKHTRCAYKGEASYLSPEVGGRVIDDLVWTYPQPLHDADRVTDLVAFFDEKVDLVLDGERRERPITPWS